MHINELKNKYSEGCYIVGKGPSLIEYTNYNDWPIFCLHQAVVPVEELNINNKIYNLQQDIWCSPWVRSYPNKATILASTHCKHIFNNAYIYDQVNDLKIPDKIITAVSAVACAKLMGCKYIIFIGFDAAFGISDYPQKYTDAWRPYTSLESYKYYYTVIRLFMGRLQIPGEFRYYGDRKIYTVSDDTVKLSEGLEEFLSEGVLPLRLEMPKGRITGVYYQ